MMKKLKSLLVGGVALALAIALVAGACAPAAPEEAPEEIAEPEVIKWRMQTFIPAGNPFTVHAQDYFVDAVEKLSNGRLIIASHGDGEIVGGMEVADAVSSGILEMGYWWPAYDMGKDPVGGLLGGCPFDFAQVTFAPWYYEYGGKELMQEFYGRFNLQVVGLTVEPAGAAMYWTKRIATLDEMSGTTVRAAGIHAKILEKADLGVGIKMLPGGEIYTSLELGVVDGAEFASPITDEAFGLHEVAPYHQTPGWQEPVKLTILIANQDAWAELPDDLKYIVEVAARDAEMNWHLKMVYGSAEAYKRMLEQTTPLRLSDADLARLYDASQAYYDEMAAKDEFYTRVLKSMRDYNELVAPLEQLWDFRFERP